MCPKSYLQNPPPIRIGGMVSRSLYQYTLQAPDIARLYRATAEFETGIRQLPGLSDVNSDLLISSPMLNADIDRERASALGVTAGGIESLLYNAFGSRQVSDIYTPTNDYRVILELLPNATQARSTCSMFAPARVSWFIWEPLSRCGRERGH